MIKMLSVLLVATVVVRAVAVVVEVWLFSSPGQDLPHEE